MFNDYKESKDNVITHKISGFKLENLLESFDAYGLQLANSVEFIVTSWTLCHLIDPLGTLEQAYHLLNKGNGFLFGTGFYNDPCSYAKKDSFSTMLALAFGIHNYIVREAQPNHFALYRCLESPHSYVKNNFEYDKSMPVYNTDRMDCFAQCRANVKPKKYEIKSSCEFGGFFHGFGTYVLEQLLGYEERKIRYENNYFEIPLFQNLHFLKLY